MEDIELSGFILQHAIAGEKPKFNLEYQNALKSYKSNADLQKTVETMARGMGLHIIPNKDETRYGLFLIPHTDSKFAPNMTQISTRLSIRSRSKLDIAETRLLMVVVGFAAMLSFYPDEDSLRIEDNREVTATEIVDRLKSVAEEVIKELGSEQALLAAKVLERIRDLPESKSTEIHSLMGMVETYLSFLSREGYISEVKAGTDRFRGNHKYQASLLYQLAEDHGAALVRKFYGKIEN